MTFMQGKRALITGVASTRSIAFGVAQAMKREGAELAFTCQSEKLRERVTKMAKEHFDSDLVIVCDVSDDQAIEQAFSDLQQHWNNFDVMVHSIAFAPTELLDGDYLDTLTRKGFEIAHDVSSYSFAALAKAAAPMMNDGGSMVTMTYLGSVRAMPNYNVMGVAKASLEANMRFMAYSLGPKGIRVNAVSAGPIKTLAASGVKNLRKMLATNAEVTPLRKNVTQEEVGNAAAFLCSDLASGITGEVLYVDAGYNTVAMSEMSV